MAKPGDSRVPLPAAWPARVRSAVIHTMALAAAAMTATRGWASKHASSLVRLKAEYGRLEQALALANQELRLKDARMSRVPGHERPHFLPVERLAILELRALNCWSVQQTADRFQLSPGTVSNWMRRLDEKGSEALVQAPVPLNKYPDFVAHIVQQLRMLCPIFGYGKIAQVLSREGLHLGTSTVSRMMRRVVAPEPPSEPALEPAGANRRRPVKRVIAEHPHHAWHCDLTMVPTSMGIWTSTLPFSLRPRWPFCWWLVVLADQFSTRILKLAIFRRQPTPHDVRALIARAVSDVGIVPEHVITDMGPPFRHRAFRPWCRRIGARHLFGRLGQHGSIPFIERLIRTIKQECTTRILLPFAKSGAQKELELYQAWYNGVRPHERLSGATPDEVHDGAEPLRERARFEPRIRRPRDGRCPSPHSTSGEHSGVRLALHVRYLEGRKHLPIVTLRRVA